MPASARIGVERGGDLPGAVADQEADVGCPLAEVPEEGADLLGGPRSVRVGGDAADGDAAGTDVSDEHAAQALQRQGAVNAEEVDGQHGRRPSPSFLTHE
jgi:hypothetical protein